MSEETRRWVSIGEDKTKGLLGQREELEYSPGFRIPQQAWGDNQQGEGMEEEATRFLSDQQRDSQRQRGKKGWKGGTWAETTHSVWLEWPNGLPYMCRQERYPRNTHVTIWTEKKRLLLFWRWDEERRNRGRRVWILLLSGRITHQKPPTHNRLLDTHLSTFLKDDLSSESKVAVGGWLSKCLYYECARTKRCNPASLLSPKFVKTPTHLDSLLSLHLTLGMSRVLSCFPIPPMPMCITDFFMRTCGNGFDELPNWRFYLNGKGVCHFFCKQRMKIFHKWCIALPWIGPNTAITLVTVSEIWKAIMEVCPAWAECLLLPLGHHTAQSKYLKLELGLAAMHT